MAVKDINPPKYKPGAVIGNFTVLGKPEWGAYCKFNPASRNVKKMWHYRVMCKCGEEYIRGQSSLRTHELRGMAHCNKCLPRQKCTPKPRINDHEAFANDDPGLLKFALSGKW